MSVHLLLDGVNRSFDGYKAINDLSLAVDKGELRAVRSPAELAGEDDHVLVRSQGTAAAFPDMQPEPGGRWVIDAPRTALWQILHALEAAGHVIIEVKPTLSLETAFMHVVKGD